MLGWRHGARRGACYQAGTFAPWEGTEAALEARRSAAKHADEETWIGEGAGYGFLASQHTLAKAL